MRSRWKNRVRTHRAVSIAAVLLYAFAVSAVNLFHNEECELIPGNYTHKDVIYNNVQCPACKFLAGHISIATDYGPAVVSTEYLVISQFMPLVMVVPQNEWAYSIASRAPPSKTFS